MLGLGLGLTSIIESANKTALVSVIHRLTGGAVLLAISKVSGGSPGTLLLPAASRTHLPSLSRCTSLSLPCALAHLIPLTSHLLRFAVRGMEDRPDANRGAAAARLPDELILEILCRVPARSMHRFKCVSKRWRDLIADPLNQKRLPQTLQGFFCSDGARSYGRFISLPGRPAPLVDLSFSFLTKQPEMSNIKLLGSCNGLVLFEHRSGSASTPSYAVCNPATEQWVAVPSSGVTSHVGGEIYLLFDPAASTHFYLLRIWQKYWPSVGVEVRAYSSETRGWSDRVSDGLVNVGMATASSGRIAFANGMLYFIIKDMWKGVSQIAAMGRQGKPRIIPLPDGDFSFTLFVAQSQGRLHCMSRRNAYPRTESGLSMRVLDYNAGHWVLKHSVRFSELLGKMCDPSRFTVVSIHPDCDRVFFIRHRNGKGDRQWKLLSYDMRNKEVHALHNFGHAYCFLTPYVPYFSESSVLANKH